MDFLWDEAKNDWLKRERYVSFEEIAAMIQRYEFLDVIDNPVWPDQHCLILRIRSYTWVVPYVVDSEEHVVLKTAYPSRKYHKRYGDKE